MTFSSSVSPDAASDDEIRALRAYLPDDVREFWATTRTARLFEDRQYGQWGLEILAPQQAASISRVRTHERPNDFCGSDLIIGRFVGDSDLLVIRCDASHPDFGHVLVALPLDSRPDWYEASDSFGEFLADYARSGGEKFWTKIK
jgi:hypothetical protein